MIKYDLAAQPIIDRLAAVDYSVFVYDKPKIELAINKHLKALGQPLRKIVWFDSSDAARGAARDAAWDAARDAAWDAAWDAARDAAWGAARDAARGAARDAAWGAARDAAWGAALLGTGMKDNKHISKALGIWLPFMEANEAGLFLYWVMKDKIICVPRPCMTIVGTQLHNPKGPAVYWPNGEAYWFLNGVKVTKEIVETEAEKIDPRIILKETNAEVRREIVRKLGIERVCLKLGAKCIDKKDGYELLMLDLGDGRKRPYLKMKNPSIATYHIEGVEPSIKTVDAALSWRNGSNDRPQVLT